LYGEAYRRYVESLSSFARQYLKALPKPELTAVKNLPPAIAVKQQASGATSRSTVGTATELNDLLRVLFAHLAKIHCVKCGALVERDHHESVAAKTIAAQDGAKVLVAAPLDRWGKINAKELKSQLEAQGFTRLLIAKAAGYAPVKLAEAKAADLKGAAVIVDRVTVSDEGASRLRESAQLAFKLGRGVLWIVREDGPKTVYSQGLDCPNCGLEYVEPSTALLSYNHPLGACAKCQGFGYSAEIDFDKVVPKKHLSLTRKGVAAWNFGQFAEYYRWAKSSAKRNKIDYEKAFADYTPREWEWLLNGEGREFDGILGFFAYLDSKKYKAHFRIHAARFRKYELCTACNGGRLNDKALAPRLGGMNIAQVSDLSIEGVDQWIAAVERVAPIGAAPHEDDGRAATMGVVEALEEAHARLGYLKKIGVGYLSLNRPARTLSGGELQRINMARCLGSALTDTLFCLDEPSAGLHARDSANLLSIIKELRDQGNTVVMVEHERHLIQGADHLIEIGPKAGHEGGRVVYEGPSTPSPRRVSAGAHTGLRRDNPTSPAGEIRRSPAERSKSTRRAGGVDGPFLEVVNARTHNLKGVTVKIPTGALTAVCGVSGSGKTSLVQHTLYPLLARALGQPVERGVNTAPVADGVGPQALIEAHAEVMLVGQGGLGRSSRSNIATYLGMMDEIRRLLAAEPMAKKLGLMPGSFSFNTAGGRCETCRGLGTVTEDLSFLGEMEVICPACNGRRFTDAVLSVTLRGKNLLEILDLTVAEAREFFFDRPQITAVADVVLAMGLGYVTLGQGTSSFSGGEAQRLKLLSLLREVKVGKPSILIFDEPTTGLADSDVATLLVQLRALAARGHTLIVIEHHVDVLAAADWLVEIGPEAADEGGRMIYAGPPAGLQGVAESVTAPYLAAAASPAPAAPVSHGDQSGARL
jgi:excinuclease ABC subunit A